MKKSLVALAVLGSFSAFVLAESNVDLYGVIDESILLQKAGGGSGNKLSIGSGFTSGSRFGFRGAEDLGGGNKVGFILEQGFNIDTGNAGDSAKSFNRESALYLEGGWGRLTVGRLGTLGFSQSTAILRGSIFGTTYGMWGLDSNHNQHFSRVDNAIAYKTPSFGGISLHAMYSNKISGDDAADKWSTDNHYYGIGALYNGGDLQGSIIFESEDNKGTANDAIYHLTLGGQWKLGMITPMALYQYAWGPYTQHTGSIGANVDCAGGVLTIGAQYVTRSGDDSAFFDNHGSGVRSGNMWNVGVAYSYALSKRTKAYGFVGYADAGKGWDKDFSNVTWDEGKSKGSNFKQDVNYTGYAIGIGMVHNF